MARFLREALRGKLSNEELGQLVAGFDVVGDIAILRIPDSLRHRRREIARILLDKVNSIRTVLSQDSGVAGTFRTRQLTYLAGEDRTTTMHREHGSRLMVDLSKVYFSPRLSTERLRVALLVTPGERVLNMFAGIGSFSVMIARKQSHSQVYSIDANPHAHSLAIENIRLNKVVGRVLPILGDARSVVRFCLTRMFDRVLMPLPESARSFLGEALLSLSPSGGWIHYYAHIFSGKGENAKSRAIEQVWPLLEGVNPSLSARVVKDVGPRWSQVVLDISVPPAPAR